MTQYNNIFYWRGYPPHKSLRDRLGLILPGESVIAPSVKAGKGKRSVSERLDDQALETSVQKRLKVGLSEEGARETISFLTPDDFEQPPPYSHIGRPETLFRAKKAIPERQVFVLAAAERNHSGSVVATDRPLETEARITTLHLPSAGIITPHLNVHVTHLDRLFEGSEGTDHNPQNQYIKLLKFFHDKQFNPGMDSDIARIAGVANTLSEAFTKINQLKAVLARIKEPPSQATNILKALKTENSGIHDIFIPEKMSDLLSELNRNPRVDVNTILNLADDGVIHPDIVQKWATYTDWDEAHRRFITTAECVVTVGRVKSLTRTVRNMRSGAPGGQEKLIRHLFEEKENLDSFTAELPENFNEIDLYNRLNGFFSEKKLKEIFPAENTRVREICEHLALRDKISRTTRLIFQLKTQKIPADNEAARDMIAELFETPERFNRFLKEEIPDDVFPEDDRLIHEKLRGFLKKNNNLDSYNEKLLRYFGGSERQVSSVSAHVKKYRFAEAITRNVKKAVTDAVQTIGSDNYLGHSSPAGVNNDILLATACNEARVRTYIKRMLCNLVFVFGFGVRSTSDKRASIEGAERRAALKKLSEQQKELFKQEHSVTTENPRSAFIERLERFEQMMRQEREIQEDVKVISSLSGGEEDPAQSLKHEMKKMLTDQPFSADLIIRLLNRHIFQEGNAPAAAGTSGEETSERKLSLTSRQADTAKMFAHDIPNKKFNPFKDFVTSVSGPFMITDILSKDLREPPTTIFGLSAIGKLVNDESWV